MPNSGGTEQLRFSHRSELVPNTPGCDEADVFCFSRNWRRPSFGLHLSVTPYGGESNAETAKAVQWAAEDGHLAGASDREGADLAGGRPAGSAAGTPPVATLTAICVAIWVLARPGLSTRRCTAEVRNPPWVRSSSRRRPVADRRGVGGGAGGGEEGGGQAACGLRPCNEGVRSDLWSRAGAGVVGYVGVASARHRLELGRKVSQSAVTHLSVCLNGGEVPVPEPSRNVFHRHAIVEHLLGPRVAQSVGAGQAASLDRFLASTHNVRRGK